MTLGIHKPRLYLMKAKQYWLDPLKRSVLHNQVKILPGAWRKKETEFTFLSFSPARVPLQHFGRFRWWRELGERLGMTYLTDHISLSVSKTEVPLRETKHRQCSVKSRVIQRRITPERRATKDVEIKRPDSFRYLIKDALCGWARNKAHLGASVVMLSIHLIYQHLAVTCSHSEFGPGLGCYWFKSLLFSF